MALRQMVTGFFEHVAEAQQAVQLLLSSDFARESLSMTTQTASMQSTLATAGRPPSDFTNKEAGTDESASGHFLVSLFGSVEETGPRQLHPDETNSGIRAQANSLRSGATVTVMIQSTAEAERATELLHSAGATTD